jgi:thymidylate synthase (FAD)
MRQIEAYFEFEYDFSGVELLKRIEHAGRICYKSESRISENSYLIFVKNILESGHESVLEHAVISIRVVCDRGVSHEIVRHRIASYSQESTRYCNYSQDKFGNEITYITPCFLKDHPPEATQIWQDTMANIEEQYLRLIAIGLSPQEARSILPNSLKTEIIMTMNLREWRHFFKLRTSAQAHPQMQEIATKILIAFKEKVPLVFDDIN